MTGRMGTSGRGFLPLSHWQILAVFAGMAGGVLAMRLLLVPDLGASAIADPRAAASLVEKASAWTGGLAVICGVVVAVACDTFNRFAHAWRARGGAADREIQFLTSLGSRRGADEADPSSFSDEPR